LKVLQKPADYQDKPKDTDASEGRAVTVAGKIVGKQALPQGGIQYTYPLLEVKDLQLWPVPTPDTYYAYPY
jgi:outer membrane lipoprotein